MYSRAVGYSAQCQRIMNDSGILEHSTTAHHARDMLEIIQKRGEAKLKYWGFSYGTILGGTFAAMFPDRVERLVSDGELPPHLNILLHLSLIGGLRIGNVDYEEWYRGYQTSLVLDSDAVMEKFYETCYEAGPEKCAFWAAAPLLIKAKVRALLEKLKVDPVVVPASESGPEVPELVTYAKVKDMIHTVLYKPVLKFEGMAKAFAALERGDGSAYYASNDSSNDPVPSKFCVAEDIPPMTPINDLDIVFGNDAFPAITCSDGDPVNSTVEEFQQFSDYLEAMSEMVGTSEVSFRMQCVGRTVEPKWRFSGKDASLGSFSFAVQKLIARQVLSTRPPTSLSCLSVIRLTTSRRCVRQ